jgi:hypothetical protein
LTHAGETRNCYTTLIGNKEEDYLEDLYVNGRRILKTVLEEIRLEIVKWNEL